MCCWAVSRSFLPSLRSEQNRRLSQGQEGPSEETPLRVPCNAQLPWVGLPQLSRGREPQAPWRRLTRPTSVRLPAGKGTVEMESSYSPKCHLFCSNWLVDFITPFVLKYFKENHRYHNIPLMLNYLSLKDTFFHILNPTKIDSPLMSSNTQSILKISNCSQNVLCIWLVQDQVQDLVLQVHCPRSSRSCFA